jgi:hypothetical protein
MKLRPLQDRVLILVVSSRRRKPLAACAFDPSRLFAEEPTCAKGHDACASASISSGRWRTSRATVHRGRQ